MDPDMALIASLAQMSLWHPVAAQAREIYMAPGAACPLAPTETQMVDLIPASTWVTDFNIDPGCSGTTFLVFLITTRYDNMDEPAGHHLK